MTTKIIKLATKIAKLQAQLAVANEAYATERLKMLRTVEMDKNGATITLVNGDDVFKAVLNEYRGRYKVTKNKKTLINEYSGSIHDLRFDIAMGNIA